MARHSRKGSRASSSYTGSRATSPPPPYSPPYAGEPDRQHPPPPYTRPQRNEQSPLLSRHERVCRTRETTTRWEWTWTAPRYQPTTRSYGTAPHCQPTTGTGWTEYCGVIAITIRAIIVVLIFVGPCLYFSLHLWSYFHHTSPPPRYSVAIIGAGPAGISAAAHLRNSPAARGVDFEITVFEAGSAIGGQLAQFGSPDSPEGARGPVFPYNDSALDPLRAEDVAGPALLWGNPLFTRSSEDILGGDELEFFDLPSQKVGYYSGDRHEVFVQTTRPYYQTPTWDWLGLILRYGASVWRAGGLLDESAGLRERMASAAATEMASSAVADVPAILALLLGDSALPHEGAPETLHRLGVSEAYAAEVLAPQVERGGPSVRISWMSGLALAMLAGREDAGDAHAGGDYTARIREIAKSLGADVRVRSKVVGIERERPGSGEGENEPVARWLLQHEGAAEAEAFDKVIVAAPGLEGLVVRVAGVNGSVEAEEAVEFDAAHVTFFTASELPGRLGGGDWAPPQILFVGDDAEGGMREVAYVREVVRRRRDGAAGGAPVVLEHLYRCVSGADVSEALLSEPGVTWMHHHRLDHAYPLTYPRTSYPPFAVGDGLWTTAPIYSIGSSLDLSWLAGRVVAQHVIEAVKK